MRCGRGTLGKQILVEVAAQRSTAERLAFRLSVHRTAVVRALYRLRKQGLVVCHVDGWGMEGARK
jgi:predicted transcriptional regulator